MALCSKCQSVRIFDKFEKYEGLLVRHHRTQADLMISSGEGCELCSLVLRALGQATQSQWISGIAMSRSDKLRTGIRVYVETVDGTCEVPLIVYKSRGQLAKASPIGICPY
jgi:hypothetical protein